MLKKFLLKVNNIDRLLDNRLNIMRGFFFILLFDSLSKINESQLGFRNDPQTQGFLAQPQNFLKRVGTFFIGKSQHRLLLLILLGRGLLGG